MICAWKTCTATIPANRRFCSTKCKSKYFVDVRRKKLKTMAMAHLGGKCSRCGYDKCEAALVFHHVDPTQKDFSISVDGNTRSWARIKAELKKCTLLCANCHAEVHTTNIIN